MTGRGKNVIEATGMTERAVMTLKRNRFYGDGSVGNYRFVVRV